jgi:sodium/hydrogen exchanger-like protein 6/7
MMLFWAGLRGAVGVALAAGMKGENAVALQTTVLVTVVLTVVVFGGTIGRMIEILGIRTGVIEDDDNESSDEDGYALTGEGDDIESFRPSLKSKRRSLSRGIPKVAKNGGNKNGVDFESSSPTTSDSTAPKPRYRDRTSTASSSGARREERSPSIGSDESDTDVLPAITEGTTEVVAGDLTRVWRDGQWFTVLDERYLLPVFSNATASRRQATKKAARSTQRTSFATEREFQDTMSSPGKRSTGTNSISSGTALNTPDFNGSFGDILSSLYVGPGLPQKRRDSEEFMLSGDDLGSTIDLNPLSTSSNNGNTRGERRSGSTSGSSTPIAPFTSPSQGGTSKRGSVSANNSGSDGSNSNTSGGGRELR